MITIKTMTRLFCYIFCSDETPHLLFPSRTLHVLEVVFGTHLPRERGQEDVHVVLFRHHSAQAVDHGWLLTRWSVLKKDLKKTKLQ